MARIADLVVVSLQFLQPSNNIGSGIFAVVAVNPPGNARNTSPSKSTFIFRAVRAVQANVVVWDYTIKIAYVSLNTTVKTMLFWIVN